jgi:hypothetical protein
MLTTLLVWFYISFLCWSWGSFFIASINKITKEELSLPHFSFVCLIGLSLITVIAGWLSLFIPLGNWWIQLLFLLPAIFFLNQRHSRSFLKVLKKQISDLHILSLLFLLASLLVILLMASWKIVHPDTLGYHAQTIQWIEKYKAVPGLTHLHVRFGYQGFWFVDNALFSFNFTGIDGITLLNSTALFWFFIFVVDRINHNLIKEGNRLIGLCWFLLLSMSMWSYTQVRLTATSASPDFIAALFVLAIVYILLERNVKHFTASDWLLVSFLSLVALTIKLSAAPIVLIPFAAGILILIKRKVRLLLVLFSFSILIFAPFITRNIITSGYALFPSTAIDVVNPDWTYGKQLTVKEKDYITAYAKKQGVITNEEIDTVNKMSIAEWMPGWWAQRSKADKTILILLLISFLTSLIMIKKIIRSGFIVLFSLSTMLIGIIFWFINAPDPRFGFGAILGFISIISNLIFRDRVITIPKNLITLLFMVTTALTLAYAGHRNNNFFEADQLLKPLGIEKTAYTTYDCDGLRINKPLNGDNFGNTPIPCTDLKCDKFSPRGKNLSDGFKAK